MISASTAGPGSPMASMSHCQNWRKRPAWRGSVLPVGAPDAPRRLRSERPSFGVLSPAGADAEQLFLDDVRGGADTAFEEVALLEERRLHPRVAAPTRAGAGEGLR